MINYLKDQTIQHLYGSDINDNPIILKLQPSPPFSDSNRTYTHVIDNKYGLGWAVRHARGINKAQPCIWSIFFEGTVFAQSK
jgi:hypothetical protein